MSPGNGVESPGTRDRGGLGINTWDESLGVGLGDGNNGGSKLSAASIPIAVLVFCANRSLLALPVSESGVSSTEDCEYSGFLAGEFIDSSVCPNGNPGESRAVGCGCASSRSDTASNTPACEEL